MKYLVLFACLLAVCMSMNMRAQSFRRMQIRTANANACTNGCASIAEQLTAQGVNQETCLAECDEFFTSLGLTEVPTEEELDAIMEQFVSELDEELSTEEGQQALAQFINSQEGQEIIHDITGSEEEAEELYEELQGATHAPVAA